MIAFIQIVLRLLADLVALAAENALWGEERIANELLLKPGLRVSPRSVRKSPPYSPMANAICERVIGTIRRECLD